MRTLLQRTCACGGTCGSCREAAVPSSVQSVLAAPGRPLDGRTRVQMESRFGHDFSNVRLHTDSDAGQSAREVGARAYTVGSHIAFAPGAVGTQLLAHELTHTIQQRNSGGPSMAGSLAIGSDSSPAEAEADRVASRVAAGRHAGAIGLTGPRLARAPEPPKSEEPAAKDDETSAQTPAQKPLTGKVVAGAAHQECGRKSDTRVAGFDNTTAGPHISAIDVDIKTNAHSPVTLTWANVPAGTTVKTALNGSPGAGKCSMWRKGVGKQDVDCSDPTWSNTTDSLCTPIGAFTVQGYACQLGGDSKASRVSWFHKVRGIAFHNYDPVPAYPASHGCVRIASGEADWIYDNTIPSVTTVAIRRAAGDPGPKCYKPGAKDPDDRPGYVPPKPPGGATTTPQQPGSGGEQPSPEGVDGP